MTPDEIQKFADSIKAESDKRFREAKDPRVVTAGNITIQGNPGSRLTGGANVTVAGDSKHGYAICSTCPGEDQGTGGTLPNTPFPPGCFLGTGDVITCLFSGITIDGVCQSYGLGSGSFILSASGTSINTTYNAAFVDTVDCFNVDPCPCVGTANLYDSEPLINGVHYKTWFDPNVTCAGDPDNEGDTDVICAVYCDCTGLAIGLFGGGAALFYVTGITAMGTYSNGVAFDDLIHDPYFSDTLVSAHGGTVTVSW